MKINKEIIKIKHPGAFTNYCKKNGFEGVNCACVNKAMNTDNPILHKQANFARNFALKGKC